MRALLTESPRPSDDDSDVVPVPSPLYCSLLLPYAYHTAVNTFSYFKMVAYSAPRHIKNKTKQVGALHAQAAEKDGGLNMAREENARLKEGLGMYQKELERLASENRILKRAVGIQNTKGKEVCIICVCCLCVVGLPCAEK